MPAPLDTAAALERATVTFEQFASAQLKMLIETKHLYQRLSFYSKEKVYEIRDLIGDERGRGSFEGLVSSVFGTCQLILIPPEQIDLYRKHRDDARHEILVDLGSVKTFCDACGEREAAAPIWIVDVSNEVRAAKVGRLNLPDAQASVPLVKKPVQVFCISYQCQRCSGHPQVFTVRREGWSLILDGRSPMEQIDVPAYIPSKERKLYADAIVSSHAGKPLAGLFYLRTFIEQFARRQTGMASDSRIDGDTLMDEYSKTLPAAHRGTMPSLKEWYQKLSEALHAASEDEELFEEARGKIEQHMDIRRVYKMPDAVSAPKNAR